MTSILGGSPDQGKDKRCHGVFSEAASSLPMYCVAGGGGFGECPRGGTYLLARAPCKHCLIMREQAGDEAVLASSESSRYGSRDILCCMRSGTPSYFHYFLI